jgi:hypothetical protein
VLPEGRRFAFTIIDDTDVATVANVKPFYDLLYDLGMRATKTVWPVGCPEGSRSFGTSETLDDANYREFCLALQERGFELTWHGATMESSERERTISSLERFRETFGSYPRIHVNHAMNRENLYWGSSRVDNWLLQRLFARVTGQSGSYFRGHVEGSSHWWGDLCAQHISYARNLTFNGINTTKFNPSMPYHDAHRPLVRWWFSASDAEGVSEFNSLLHPRNQEQLEAEGGVCIIATHLAKGYVQDGAVHPVTRQRLTELSKRDGWFPTVGQLLDWLREQRGTDSIPDSEWRAMQWRWARDLVVRKIHPRRRQRAVENGEGR